MVRLYNKPRYVDVQGVLWGNFLQSKISFLNCCFLIKGFQSITRTSKTAFLFSRRFHGLLIDEFEPVHSRSRNQQWIQAKIIIRKVVRRSVRGPHFPLQSA